MVSFKYYQEMATKKNEWLKMQDMKEICVLFLCEAEQLFHPFWRVLKAFYSFRKDMKA